MRLSNRRRVVSDEPVLHAEPFGDHDNLDDIRMLEQARLDLLGGDEYARDLELAIEPASELELALIIDPLAGDLIPGARGLRQLGCALRQCR